MAELLRKQAEVMREAAGNVSGYFAPMLHGEKSAAEALRRLGLFEKLTGPSNFTVEYRLTAAGSAWLESHPGAPITEGDPK